jgi:hypothetical protein
MLDDWQSIAREKASRCGWSTHPDSEPGLTEMWGLPFCPFRLLLRSTAGDVMVTAPCRL